MSHEHIRADVSEFAKRFTAQGITSITRITDGSINETFEVVLDDGGIFILQKMSPIFKPHVMENLACVTPYVVAKGVLIPAGIPIRTGESYITADDGSWYRALTYIPGKTIHDNMTLQQAKSSGALVGRFHAALLSCETPMKETVKHYHETQFYFERMRQVSRENTDEKKHATLMPIVEEIEGRIDSIDVDTSKLPQRIIHADLKVSNIRFSETGEAIAIIDMDTLMRASIVTEMGDALRSWCGTAGEDNSTQVFDESIAKAALSGYAESAEGVTQEEIKAIPEGIRILTLELASRFVTDAYEESYFAHRESLYPNLYEQCKTKAENQLRFLEAYEEKRGEL